ATIVARCRSARLPERRARENRPSCANDDQGRERERRSMSKNWKALQSEKLSPEARERARARARLQIEQLTLKALRRDLELTQVAVSRAASMTQSELSRLESRTDHLTSTLRRYVAALGGQLEIAAVFGERRVKITDA